MNIYPDYISKHNSNHGKKFILLMIPNGERWHYLVVKELSALLWGMMSKHVDDFYCLSCRHFFRTKNKFEFHKNICENKDVCGVIKPSKDTRILEFNQYWKSDKAICITYADLEFWLKG